MRRYYDEAESLQRQLVELKDNEEREYRLKWDIAQRKPTDRLLAKQAREKQVPFIFQLKTVDVNGRSRFGYRSVNSAS